MADIMITVDGNLSPIEIQLQAWRLFLEKVMHRA